MKKIRLRGFHYGGTCAYYLTICAFQKRLLFGSCADGTVLLNATGKLVEASWNETASVRPDLILDEFIVMPNHMHAIIHLIAAPPNTLFGILSGFKSHVTSVVREMLRDPTFNVWQKRFFDRVIRSGRELEEMRAYIRANPARWSALDVNRGSGVIAPKLPL